MEDDLARVQAQRNEQQNRADNLRLQNIKKINIELARGLEIGKLNSVSIDGSLPGGGFVPGSPGDIRERDRARRDQLKRFRQARADQSRQRKDALSNAIIGGAFPLLFGQGLGASVGGATGGVAGGALGGQFGFGLSLVGTALGSQVDAAVDKLKTLGAALSDPVAAFGELQSASLLSSKAVEAQVQALIDGGDKASAAAVIQRDLLENFGDLSAARQLNEDFDEMNRAVARLQATTANALAGSLSGLLDWVTTLANRAATRNLLDPDRQVARAAEADKVIQDQIGFFGGSGFFGAVSVEYDGKTFSGSAAGVRQDLVAYLFEEELKKQLGAGSKETASIESEVTQSLQKQEDIRQNLLKIGQLESQGYRLKALELKKINLELEKQKEIDGLSEKERDNPTRIKLIEDKFEEKRLDLERQIAKERDQQFAKEQQHLTNIYDIQRRTEVLRRARTEGFGSIGEGALTALNDFRRQKDIERATQAALRAEPGNLDLQRAAERASEETKLAAEVTYKKLTEAYKAAEQSVKNIKQSIEDTKAALLDARGGAGGVNKFLSASAADERQQAANVELSREANRLASQLGVTAFFRGNLVERNQQMSEFNAAARQELRGEDKLKELDKDLVKATADLRVANETLAEGNRELGLQIKTLAEKDWSIYIEAAGEVYTAGDMVNAMSRTY